MTPALPLISKAGRCSQRAAQRPPMSNRWACWCPATATAIPTCSPTWPARSTISPAGVPSSIGAGWLARLRRSTSYTSVPPRQRLDDLEHSLQRITRRLELLDPPPIRPLPILVGGGGEKRTLRIVANYASMWSTSGDAETLQWKSQELDRHCADVGRNPNEIERTAYVTAVDPAHTSTPSGSSASATSSSGSPRPTTWASSNVSAKTPADPFRRGETGFVGPVDRDSTSDEISISC